MAKKKTKTKSHGKPTIKASEYASTMDALGIGLDEYSSHRLKSEKMYYIINCHYKRTLDHQRYHWAHMERYASDMYESKIDALTIIQKLEKQYPHWFFETISIFSREDVDALGCEMPKNVLCDLNAMEIDICNKLGISVNSPDMTLPGESKPTKKKRTTKRKSID